MKKLEASVHALKDPKFFCMTTMSHGSLNFGEPNAQPIYLAPNAADDVLGKSLREALSKSRLVSAEEFQEIVKSGVIQRNAKERESWRMKNYGYGSKRELYCDMECCVVNFSDGQIEIVPTDRNSLDGMRPISNDDLATISISASVKDSELGAALREGFSRCTNSYKE